MALPLTSQFSTEAPRFAFKISESIKNTQFLTTVIKAYLLPKRLTTYTYYKCQSILASLCLQKAGPSCNCTQKHVHSVCINKHAQFNLLICSSDLFSCLSTQKHNQNVRQLPNLRWYCVSPVRQLIYKIICNWL